MSMRVFLTCASHASKAAASSPPFQVTQNRILSTHAHTIFDNLLSDDQHQLECLRELPSYLKRENNLEARKRIKSRKFDMGDDGVAVVEKIDATNRIALDDIKVVFKMYLREPGDGLEEPPSSRVAYVTLTFKCTAFKSASYQLENLVA